MGRTNPLELVEDRLRGCRGSTGRRVAMAWATECPALAAAAPMAPGDVPAWVWGLDKGSADEVLRMLVGRAQRGDEVALLAVLACLRPGLRSIERHPPRRRRQGRGSGGSARVRAEDVVAVATARILELPLGRRAAVASGILLDVWHELWLEAQPDQVVTVAQERLSNPASLVGCDEVEPSAGETLLRLVADAHRAGLLAVDDARLIVETRVLGEPVAAAAQRRGVEKKTAYWRRRRAELCLAAAVAA